jgi:beta-glucosidase
VDGEEIVQLYFKDKICKILTPVRNLLDFKRVKIKAGESVKVSFEIDPETLGYYDKNCNYCVDSGDFAFYISGDGKNFKEVTLTLKD